jgi:hypothetical protein
MNWDDVPILVGSLLAIVLSFVWSRSTTVGPVLFAWTGAAVGGTVAFIRHYNENSDQVGIEYILPYAALGAAFGLLPGFAVRAAYLKGGRGRKAILEAIAAVILFVGLGMVFGWDIFRRSEYVVSGVLGSGAFFGAIGALLARDHWRARMRQSVAESGAEPDPPAEGKSER